MRFLPNLTYVTNTECSVCSPDACEKTQAVTRVGLEPTTPCFLVASIDQGGITRLKSRETILYIMGHFQKCNTYGGIRIPCLPMIRIRMQRVAFFHTIVVKWLRAANGTTATVNIFRLLRVWSILPNITLLTLKMNSEFQSTMYNSV